MNAATKTSMAITLLHLAVTATIVCTGDSRWAFGYLAVVAAGIIAWARAPTRPERKRP